MRLKSNKAFTLLEVIITVGILATGIVFLFRSFAMSLTVSKFSQDLSLACFIAEEKIWEAEEKQLGSASFIEPDFGTKQAQGRDFKWNYSVTGLPEFARLGLLKLDLSWKEGPREKGYSTEFLTYLRTE